MDMTHTQTQTRQIPDSISRFARFGGLSWLDESNWRDFETLFVAFHQLRGYSIGKLTGPEGRVWVLSGEGGKVLARCQPWHTRASDAQSVRDLHQMQLKEKAGCSVLISSGVYTGEALAYAERKPITLVDGTQCLELLPKLKEALAAAKYPAPLAPENASARPFPPSVLVVLGQARRPAFGRN
jgi:restriction system protein